ncbi:MAG: hypothetical protein K2J08_07855 [Ruminococcus sp.]|nr:hypothetical protein [Ruminococcus sp.]
MIECGIVHSGFSQGGLDSSTGEEREDTWSVRTDFAEIPYGLQTISTTVLVGRKIWKSKEQEYEYAESTTDTLRYVYFYDENKNFMGYTYRNKNNDSPIDFFKYLGAKYVRFYITLITVHLYPNDDDIPIKESGYYLKDFSTNCQCVEWNLNENNKLIHEDLNIAPEKAISKPYPKALWRIDYTSPNLPYHKLFPNIHGLDIWSLERENIIRVYDLHEPQDGFKHNGLAILAPSSCVSTHELNGRWDVELTHPMDDFGRWRFLLPHNVLKIGGQLFRIDETEADTDAQTIKVHAKHIFYDLADNLLLNKSAKNLNGISFINFIMNSRIINNEYKEYNFQYNSDFPKSNYHSAEFDNVSPVGALIGDEKCFVNLFGGELYRNNFYFSVNSRMENASDNAFSLRYGGDIQGISQKIDYSDWCTYLITEDNFGDYFAVSFTLNNRIHHHKFRYQKFTYQKESQSDDGGKLNNSLKISTMELLRRDSFKLWGQIWLPSVTYTVNIASLRKHPKYRDFLNLQNYNVGDRGTIYCGLLDINTVQQIVSMEKDELTGDVLNIKLGNTANSLIRPNYRGENAFLLTDEQQKQLDETIFNSTVSTPIATADGKFLTTTDGKYILYKRSDFFGIARNS